MSLWCAYTWKGRLQRRKLFLHAPFFVINAPVPWTTGLTIFACLQIFAVLQSTPPSFPIHQHFSPHQSTALLKLFLPPERAVRWLGRPCQLNHAAVATAVPNGRGVTCCSLETVLGPHPFLGCRSAGTSMLAYLWDLCSSLKSTNRFRVIKEGLTDKQTDRQAEQLCKLCFLRKAG